MRLSPVGLVATLALAILVAPLAHAQPLGKVFRVGILTPGTFGLPIYHQAFKQRLQELGYVDGQNLALEVRAAEGQFERLPGLAAELVRLNVDVIVTLGGTTRIAQSATRTIPIVMVEARDPVEAGFVTSLAQPGGNITGLAGLGAELSGKRLEILKQVVPQLSRVALLLNPTLDSSADNVRETQRAAQALGVAVQVLEVRRPEDIEGAFAAVPQTGARAAPPPRGGPGAAERAPSHVPLAHVCGSRWPHVLWHQSAGVVPARRHLRGQDSQRGEARGPARGAAHAGRMQP